MIALEAGALKLEMSTTPQDTLPGSLVSSAPREADGRTPEQNELRDIARNAADTSIRGYDNNRKGHREKKTLRGELLDADNHEGGKDVIMREVVDEGFAIDNTMRDGRRRRSSLGGGGLEMTTSVG